MTTEDRDYAGNTETFYLIDGFEISNITIDQVTGEIFAFDLDYETQSEYIGFVTVRPVVNNDDDPQHVQLPDSLNMHIQISSYLCVSLSLSLSLSLCNDLRRATSNLLVSVQVHHCLFAFLTSMNIFQSSLNPYT